MCDLRLRRDFIFLIKHITKFRAGDGAGVVVSSESGTVGGAGGLFRTVGAGAGA